MYSIPIGIVYYYFLYYSYRSKGEIADYATAVVCSRPPRGGATDYSHYQPPTLTERA